jgi:hypothetical protein
MTGFVEGASDNSRLFATEHLFNKLVDLRRIDTPVGFVSGDDERPLGPSAFFVGGKCQYIPNSFVPVPPEQGDDYNSP